jgi:HD superfamily phosphohydrolase
MAKFDFMQLVKNNIKNIDDPETEHAIKGYLEYIHMESKKGKMPLIIVGAGISCSDVLVSKDILISDEDHGLPTLNAMIRHIYDYVYKYSRENGNADLSSLQHLFLDYENFEKLEPHMDREWLSKVFATMANSKSESVKDIWEEFYKWFLFRCIDNKQYGALNTRTTKAAKEIQKFAQKCKALCLSTNFDNYMTSAAEDPWGKSLPGMSIFSKHIAEKYFSRTRRQKDAVNKPPDQISNNCVIHANGDVFWLTCSGDAVDGYCPRTNKYSPAYSWVSKNNTPEENQLVCDICHSKLRATMNMPGTYKKDHDTREMLSAIWKYVSSKISTVITIGISCDWDDVLLQFIIGLLYDNKIPHLDINIISKEKGKSTAVHSGIIDNKSFFSFGLSTTAREGVEYLNQWYENIKDEQNPVRLKFEESEINEINKLLEKVDFIKRLKHISQIGLKGYWKSAITDNDRWEHSKEVAGLALKFYNKICANSGREPDVSEQALIYISGLLHDCGHLPFSHLMEDVFSELSWKFEYNEETFNHNHYTSYLIRKLFTSDIAGITAAEQKERIEKIRQFIKKYNVDHEDIIKVINGNYGIGYIDALINSEIDCDKIAYLYKDSDQTNMSFLFNKNNKEEFLDELLKNAYITEEGLIALDSESAWIAFRMLDERKRFYSELYYADDIRCLELAVKYIVITYFVQQYNEIEKEKYEKYKDEKYGDLSHCRIMMVIDDLFDSANIITHVSMKDSLSEQTLKTLKQCMGICLGIIKKRTDNAVDKPKPNGKKDKEPNEITILKKMYEKLTGDYSYQENKNGADSEMSLFPYTDNDLNNLSKKLGYEQLFDVRKRIHLNFPGVLLIDVYESVKYLARAKSRKKKFRIDGTEENQVIYLVPPGDRNTWHNNEALASIDISKYVDDNKLDDTKCTFNVYKLSNDETMIEYAINMLKKEMEIKIKAGNEAEDE